MKLRGVYVATVTPFTDSGALDRDALSTHLQFLVRSGVDGLVPCGTTGEGPTLDASDRSQAIKACLEAAAPGGLQVIAGCGGNNTAAVVAAVEAAEALGCHGSLVVTPYYNKPTQAGLIAHYQAVANAATKPIILYHVPGRTSVSLSLDTVRELFAHPRIAGIKEASGNYAYWLGLAQVAQDTGKAVLAGDDDAFAVCQAYGGSGIISASANALPAQYVQLHRWMEQSQWEKAFELQLRLAPLVRAFFCETNPGPIKFLLSRMYPLRNRLRLPLVPVMPESERQIVEAWEHFQSSVRVGKNDL